MATNISVIIPAYNAATTINQTLESLLAQTFPNWEAIVINDGSVDGTTHMVSSFCENDSRIKMLYQPNQGLSAARNKGIEHANFEWLLFLDADDWISPYYVEQITRLIDSDSSLDAVHCGWVRIAPDGTQLKEKFAPEISDLFPVLATMCPFAVHACVVKKIMTESAGKFDTSVKNCQDWDFWQRLARTGARFGAVKQVLAFYRMQPNSLSSDADQFYANAIKMLVQGHSADSRVLSPHPDHINGQSKAALPSLKLYLTSWFGGLFIGKEKDAMHLLKVCEKDHEPNLEALIVAENIFETVLISGNLPLTAWHKLWEKFDRHIIQFLTALEFQSKSEGLAKSTLVILEGMILQHTQLDQPVTIGTMQAIRLEVTKPIPDIYPEKNIERLFCKVEMEGSNLGILELPVCGKIVPGWLIKDAIAAQFAWQILGRFFEYTVYSDKKNKSKPDRENDKNLSSQSVHNRIGWKTFLQQLWERPITKSRRSYKFKNIHKNNSLSGNFRLPVIAISKKLPKILFTYKKTQIVLTIGGIAAGVINLPAKKLILTSGRLRDIIIKAGSFELCRVCVREALIGKPLNERTSLAERLAEAADLNKDIKNADLVDALYVPVADFITHKTVTLAYRHGLMGTSSSRRAMLPGSLISELTEMAESACEQILRTHGASNQPDNILYVPELITNSQPGDMRPIGQSIPANDKVRSTDRSLNNIQPKTLNKSSVVTQSLPILKYHHIAPNAAFSVNYNNVTPELFEGQLQYLRENNYYNPLWDDWINAMFTHTPLPGKAVAITFDDGYLDFYEHAWPLLRKYSFSATVFISTGCVGDTNSWNKNLIEQVPLMGWPEIIALQKEGVQFGSHSVTHRSLTALSPAEIVSEAAKSRTTLQHALREPVKIFSYPYGHNDAVVAHLVGACGYTLGLTSKPALSTFMDNTMTLPRLEVKDSVNLQGFIDKLDSRH